MIFQTAITKTSMRAYKSCSTYDGEQNYNYCHYLPRRNYLLVLLHVCSHFLSRGYWKSYFINCHTGNYMRFPIWKHLRRRIRRQLSCVFLKELNNFQLSNTCYIKYLKCIILDTVWTYCCVLQYLSYRPAGTRRQNDVVTTSF